MFYYPYNQKPNRQKYTAMQYPSAKQPSIRIDPPDNLPEGRDSGASSPLPETPRPDQRMPQRIPSTPPLPDSVIRRAPRRAPEPIDDDYYPTRPPVSDTFPQWPEEPYPSIPDYEPIDDEYEPESTYPRPRGTVPSPNRSAPPSRQQPPPYESDTFVHNGQQYQCEWVYCCRPVDAKMPERLEPNAYEDFLDLIIWQDDTFPEYKIDKCNSSLGFCMNTRESTFSIIARIIFPKDITGEIRREIEECLERGTEAAFASILLQIKAMEALPESIPAVIPKILKTAYIVGKEAFFVCIRKKKSSKVLKDRVRFSVFHDQTSNEGWRSMTEQDALKLLEKIYLHSTGLALIPGVGSFDDLANKIGLDRVDLEGIFRNAGKSVTEVADKLKEKAKGLGEAIEGIPSRLPRLPSPF